MLTKEQEALRARARELAQAEFSPTAAETDRSEAYPWANIEKLRSAGFMGMTIPKEYGGQGASYLDAVLVIEEVARACAAMGRVTVEANMGAIGAIIAYGSEQQKRIAAECVLGGDKPAICISEPGAGSSASEMRTVAVRRGSTYVIDGHKYWITGGEVSRLHLIFARVIEDGVDQGIGGFMVLRNQSGLPGVEFVRTPAMGIRGIPETHMHIRDLEVDASMLVAPPSGLRKGFASLMNAYNGQRVGAATVALGIAQGAFDEAVGYSKSRRQFGRPIAEFQGLQWMLADMSIQLDAARLLVHRAANVPPGQFPDMKQAAQAKIFTAEMAIKVTNDALQIFGSSGYSREMALERHVRDARMFTIAGGTAQVLRNQVASSILGAKLPQTRDGYVKRPIA